MYSNIQHILAVVLSLAYLKIIYYYCSLMSYNEYELTYFGLRNSKGMTLDLVTLGVNLIDILK